MRQIAKEGSRNVTDKRCQAPVPHDEYCRIVLVNATVMVHSVVAGGVEQPLCDSRQLADRLGVYPELVDSVQLMHSRVPETCVGVFQRRKMTFRTWMEETGRREASKSARKSSSGRRSAAAQW